MGGMNLSDKKIAPEKLAEHNGKGDKPAYVAYKGSVYDVDQSELWVKGVHMKRHQAGKDLTAAMEAAPHGPEVLERVPQVGTLSAEKRAEPPMPKALSNLLGRFPILRRHPHPSVVHFPIVFMVCAPLFTMLYLITGIKSFEITGLHCLGAGILFTPIAIFTGFFTWWLNYLAEPMRSVTIKIRLSFVLMAVSVVVFVWRLAVPDLLSSLGGATIIYLVLLLSLIPLVFIIGWLGGLMTFPIERG